VKTAVAWALVIFGIPLMLGAVVASASRVYGGPRFMENPNSPSPDGSIPSTIPTLNRHSRPTPTGVVAGSVREHPVCEQTGGGAVNQEGVPMKKCPSCAEEQPFSAGVLGRRSPRRPRQ
jgi:hypothetical protein